MKPPEQFCAQMVNVKVVGVSVDGFKAFGFYSIATLFSSRKRADSLLNQML